MANSKEIVPYTHTVSEIVYSTPEAPSSATNKVMYFIHPMETKKSLKSQPSKYGKNVN